jgi:hypothetical protein
VEFRQELMEQVDTPWASSHFEAAELSARWKGESTKIELAREWPSQTTMP